MLQAIIGIALTAALVFYFTGIGRGCPHCGKHGRLVATHPVCPHCGRDRRQNVAPVVAVAGPGWYQDPTGEHVQRYHNGETWTNATRPFDTPYGDEAPPSPVGLPSRPTPIR